MSDVPASALANMRRTVQAYEGFCARVRRPVRPRAFTGCRGRLRRMMQLVPRGGSVLEVGSGPGREASFVETLGAAVRRTDATKAFLEVQTERGKSAELLNVVTDELGEPYDAVLALCVLIHVGREEIDAVLRKVHGALGAGWCIPGLDARRRG